MVLRLVGRGRVGRCQPSFLSELTGGCWPVCGLVFPGFLFFGGGGVDPSGVGTPTTFLFYQPEPGVVVGKERTNHLGTFAHAATHLPNTLMAWTKAQASAESYLKL